MATARQKALAVARRKRLDKLDSQLANRRDPADTNRYRLANWGERAGPGLLTLQNIIIFLMILLVIFYLSKLSV